jgi:hypothetical protein
MRIFLICAMIISNFAFAYHSGTNMNYPVKEEAVYQDKRQPASEVKEDVKIAPSKVAPKQ